MFRGSRINHRYAIIRRLSAAGAVLLCLNALPAVAGTTIVVNSDRDEPGQCVHTKGTAATSASAVRGDGRTGKAKAHKKREAGGKDGVPDNCTLRTAIETANARPGGAVIAFDLPALPYRIDLQSPLPAIGSNVVIDGSTQTGAECPFPIVQLSAADVTEPAANGLEIKGHRSLVRGLVVRRFSGHGIVISGSDNRVECSFVGTDVTGTEPSGNDKHGIAIIGGVNNALGGASFERSNLISANGGRGIYIEEALNTLRSNNFVGVDVFDQLTLPNGAAPVGRINPPPAKSRLSPAREARVTQWLLRKLNRRLARSGEVLVRSRLFDDYKRRLSVLQPDLAPPKTLGELTLALASEPKLYAAFTAAAANALMQTNRADAIYINRIRRLAQRTLPGFGRDVPNLPEDDLDLGERLVAARAPEDYFVSKAPTDIVAVQNEDAIIGVSPLTFHSLETYGPKTFNSTISTANPGDSGPVRVCANETQCFWPIAYDLRPHHAQLLWQSSTLSAQEIGKIVQEDDHFLELRVNGRLLRKGPIGGGDSFAHLNREYDAIGFSDAPCPAGKRCIATNVLVRKALADVPQPWVFELKVQRLNDLPNPIIDGIDEFGNPISKTKETELIAKSAIAVLAQPVNGNESWFDEAIVETFNHPRCTDCHGFGDFTALAQHHGYSDVENFVNATNLRLEPSLYVPGGHVMKCDNCHFIQTVDANGHPFHEIEWIAPFEDLDIDWGAKTSRQICERVKQNLPTKYDRQEHFHGDARLFWAVEDATILGGQLAKAPPTVFAEFLRRIDLWNHFGAPCPQ